MSFRFKAGLTMSRLVVDLDLKPFRIPRREGGEVGIKLIDHI